MSSKIHLPDIHRALIQGRTFWKKHALERTMERNISRYAVKQAILDGDIIEEYPADYLIPSMLRRYWNPNPCIWFWPGMKNEKPVISLPSIDRTSNTLNPIW